MRDLQGLAIPLQKRVSTLLVRADEVIE